MKKFKKIAGLMLALVIALAMGVTALAADTNSYTITIENETSGYTYTAYQIFKGDLSDGILSNVEFGSALSATDQADLLKYYSSTTNNILDGTNYEKSAAGLAAALADGKITASDFAEKVATYSLTSAGTFTYDSSEKEYNLTVTGAGYYLIKNTAVPEKDGAYTNYILKVVGNVSVEPKAAVPSSDKTVADINDSTDASAATSTNDSADYDIGDNVPFTLTATMPTNYGDYDTYKLTFHDELSSGLSFNSSSVVVTVTTGTTTTTVDSGYTLAIKGDSTNPTTDDCSFEVIIADTNALYDDQGDAISVTAGSVITVTYTAELLTNAGYKETNTMHIVYSNNPNSTTDTGTSTTDLTTVFTYTLTLDKTDSSGNPLEGAVFTLYKYVGVGVQGADANGYISVAEVSAGYQVVSITEFTSGVTYYTYNDNTQEYTEVTDTSGAPDSGTTYYVKNTFTFAGLDDGQYKLVETTTPSGYNTMTDLVFYIVAAHDENGITSLKVTSDSAGQNEITGYTENTSNGTITATIVNYKGSELPSTGGIGTTIFYIVGTLLILLAAVLLITRSRMRRSEEK